MQAVANKRTPKLMRIYRFFILIALLLLCAQLQAQTFVKGRIIDAETKQPLAFANVAAPETRQGIMTDIDGKFQITFKQEVDSFYVTYVGYESRTIKISGDNSYYLIRLNAVDFELSEVTVVPGKNPAHRIIKKAIENRKKNNPESDGAFILSSYNKLLVKPEEEYVKSDSSQKDSLGKRLLEEFSDKNIFIMETVSQRYFEAPDKVKEKVLHTQVSGLKNPFFFLLASQLQSFTFYRDIINIGGYRLVNPISRGSTNKYWFRIEDTTYVEGPQDTVFTISFRKRGDRSFNGMEGVVQIGSQDFAIRSVIARPIRKRAEASISVSDSALVAGSSSKQQQDIEINIQQKYEKVEGRKWFPVQLNTDIVLNTLQLDGVPVKVEGRTYIQNVELKDNIKNSVFDENYVEMDEDAAIRNDSVMGIFRVDSLTEKERRTYEFIDSISEEVNLEKKIAAYKVLLEGSIPWGKFSFPLDRMLAYNVYQGYRFGLGITTNHRFSKIIKPSIYGGWSTRDHTWKYGAAMEVKLWDRHDFYLKAKYHNDLREVGELPDFNSKGLLGAYQLREYLASRMDQEELRSLALKFRMLKYAEVETGLRERKLQFYDDYIFGIRRGGNLLGLRAVNSTEYFVELRYAFRERHLKTPLGKTSLGTRYPVLWLNYTRGLNLMNGQLLYDKIDLQLQKTFHTKYIGSTSVLLRAGMAPADIPVSLQYTAFGSYYNYTIACPGTFNTMHVNEFAANEYVAVHLEHDFKKHLIRSKHFQPAITLTTSAIWGRWEGLPYQHDISYKALNQGYYESGVMLQNLIKSNFSTFGLGFYYRYGPYSLDTFKDNMAIKLVGGLAI